MKASSLALSSSLSSCYFISHMLFHSSSLSMSSYEGVLGRQKSYTDLKRKDIQYEIGEKVFLKVLPWKKVMRFGKNGKLSPRFIGPYEVIKKVSPVAYILALPPKLEKIHNVFHLSMLRRYMLDPSHVVSLETIELRPDLTYEEELVEILAREVKELWKSESHWSKCCGETTRLRKPRGKAKKLCGNNTLNC